MKPAGRERQRCAWGDSDQPALRIERVEESEQVELVGPAAVQEHQGAPGPAVRWAQLVLQEIGRRMVHARSRYSGQEIRHEGG